MILKIKKKTKKPQFADRTVQKCKRVQYRISTDWKFIGSYFEVQNWWT